MTFEIGRSDARWYDSADAGDPGCLCSRCLRPIGEDCVPIRAWPEDGRYEYRHHPECLGFDPIEDDELEDGASDFT